MYKTAEILLVEDDLADQKLVRKSLGQAKIANELHTVNNGEQALEYLQGSKNGNEQTPMPDLILLDLNMPGMGGQELLRHLKSDDELDIIPIVILTTSDADKDILESFKLQAAGYIKKPVTLEGFHEVTQVLSEYWFVICKRISHDNKSTNKTDQCLISR